MNSNDNKEATQISMLLFISSVLVLASNVAIMSRKIYKLYYGQKSTLNYGGNIYENVS